MAEKDKKNFDEAWLSPAGVYLREVLDLYLKQLIDKEMASADAKDKYANASWAYLQADSVGARRTITNLRTTLNFEVKK